MLEITRAYPQIAAVAGDLIVKNMDVPGAQDLAERLKKTLPPELQDKEGGEQLPPQVQAQMTQMNQMIEMLTQQLDAANDKNERERMKLESEERIALKKLEVELEIETAKLDQRDSQAMLQAEIAQINDRLNLIGVNEEINFETDPQMNGAMGASPLEAQTTPQQFTGELPPGPDMEGN